MDSETKEGRHGGLHIFKSKDSSQLEGHDSRWCDLESTESHKGKESHI